MYEDMIDHISGYRRCKKCEKITRHSLVEYVQMDENINVVDVIDSWFQCQICGQTAAIPREDDGFPF